jgi:soluble lytic murein transglycosylase-like protein
MHTPMMRHSTKLLAAVVLSAAQGEACASIFAFTDERGVVHYSNVPVDSRYEVFLAAPADPADPAASTRALATLLRRTEPFAHLIDAAARTNGVEASLIRAVIVAESGCDPNATSRRGARGLMQLMPATARQYGVHDVLDPEQNIRAGTRYLRDLLDHYQHDLERVLAAYNAGPAAVDQHAGAIPPFRETLDYVPRVLRIYHHLSARAPAR